MVKKKDVEKRLKQNGWYFARHGSNHDIWTNGKIKTQVPRHRNISDRLYKNQFVKKLHLK